MPANFIFHFAGFRLRKELKPDEFLTSCESQRCSLSLLICFSSSRYEFSQMFTYSPGGENFISTANLVYIFYRSRLENVVKWLRILLKRGFTFHLKNLECIKSTPENFIGGSIQTNAGMKYLSVKKFVDVCLKKSWGTRIFILIRY